MSKEHQATMRKINLRILPFLMLLYLIAYIDRSNISVAALGMNADLGLTSRMYGLAAGLFFLTYIIFEVPSNVALTKFGARRWIARIMISWGLVAMGMAFITSAYQLYGMRLLLGAAEAGFTPGIIYYLARWYPSQERAHAMSFFYIGAALASVIGLPLSGLLLHADGALGVAGWRWVFFVEGLPAVLLGFVVLWFLPDRPTDASWLSQAEAYELERKIDAEQGTGQSEHKTGWQTAFRNGNVWLLAAFWLLQAFGTIGITLFMPLIVRGISSGDDLAISLLSAVPFIAACIFMFFNGRHSDSTRERAYHLGVPLTLAGLLLLAAVYIGNAHLSYVLIVLSVGLNWAVIPIFWAVTTEYVSGLTAAVSIALINALANVAGLVLPPAIGWIKDTTNSYDLALTLVSAALILGGLLGISLAKKLAAPKGLQTIIDIRNSADPVGSSKRH
ncbi:MFS transporter [Ochrobactrum sp. POC9]|uniref:MFS transporter n=1 Tax=unclassified Ochrobactrum TaxID=239106 RepID=UPI000D7053FD|nr:MFS transporter [Ochrobactrum sp. POC9]MCH4543332.1 MFS transporter [Ochrobactrum sp. A-1]PWU70979.1 MFS transporter [Ochrobactrum sp. POC9]